MMKHIFTTVMIILSCATQVWTQCVGTEGQVTWMYWGDQPEYGFDYFYSDETYPQGPDLTKTLFSVSSPFNYGSNFGSLTVGFIRVPQSGPVTFNVTGDDQTTFYLSTNDSKNNLVERAHVEAWTSRDEHEKYPGQTSVSINLTANQNYYFEVHHVEGEGGDHVGLHWKNNFISQSEWTTITSLFLADVCDAPCPPAGRTCNDGNPSTTDDMQDGNCNCVGIPSTNNSCIGDRGIVQAYFFDDHPGGDLNELYNDPDYPTMPDRMEINPNGLYAQWDGNISDYGVLIQGYLTVPLTGSYTFNLTGVSNVKFMLSTDESPSNLSTSIETIYGAGPFDHDVGDFNGSQTSNDLNLVKGNYYYYEIHQKVPNYGQRFSVYWSGDLYEDDDWHRIPAMHMYDYACELACLPAGLACNDGNPETAMDEIVNCDCAGTPCGGNTGVPCDDASAFYNNYPYCETSYELDNRADDGWLSCVAGSNPYISARSGNHWVHYDLGDEYRVNDMHIWNYNVPGLTSRGFQQVIVDYSLDGVTWTYLNTYTWNQATGNQGYSGFGGPDLNGEAARYIMFTSLDPPSTCRGISKVAFNVDTCPARGTACDDNLAQTVNDHYNSKCECNGYQQAELDCVIDTLFVNENEVSPNTYHAVKALISEDEILQSTDINYRAGMEIVLGAGFEVRGGANFLAEIEDCGGASLMPVQKVNKSKGNTQVNTIEKREESLAIYAIKDMDVQTIHFYIPESSAVKLEILDQKSNIVASLLSHTLENYGDKYKRVQTSRLPQGIYLVRLTTQDNVITDKMLVL